MSDEFHGAARRMLDPRSTTHGFQGQFTIHHSLFTPLLRE